MQYVALLFLFPVLLPSAVEGQQLADRVGEWTYMETTDAFTDETSGFLWTGEVSEGLNLGCDGDRIGFLYNIGGFMGGDREDRVRVRYRIDNAPASSQSFWSLSSDGETAWAPEEVAVSLRDRTIGASRIRLEVIDPLDGERRTHEFSLDGLDALRHHLPCLGAQGERR